MTGNRQPDGGAPWSSLFEGYTSRRGGPDMRISDAERQQMADVLGKHFADGRLDEEEFRERLGKAMGAKTQSELTGLLDDLPRLGPDPQPGPVARPRRGRRIIGLRPILLALFVLLVISSFSSFLWAPHVPWILIFVGVFLFLRGRRWHHRCGGGPWHHHYDWRYHGPAGPGGPGGSGWGGPGGTVQM